MLRQYKLSLDKKALIPQENCMHSIIILYAEGQHSKLLRFIKGHDMQNISGHLKLFNI